MSEDALTPTEELILDSLAARHRLGETLFAFSSRVRRSAEALERRGLIHVLDGNVEHSIRLSLTHQGRALALSTAYLSPLEQERNKLARRVEGLRTELSIALDRIESR